MNNKTKHRLIMTTVKLIGYIFVSIPFALCWHLYYVKEIEISFDNIGNHVFVLFYLLMFMIFCRIYNADQISLHRISEIVYSQIISFLVTDGLIYIVICLLERRLANLIPGLICIVGQFLAATIWSIFSDKWYFHTFPPKKTIVIYDNTDSLKELINEYGLGKKYEVRKTVQVEKCLQSLKILDAYEAVFLSDIHSQQRNIIMKHCLAMDKDIYIIPRLGDIILSGAKDMHMFHLPILRLTRYNPRIEFIVIKRVFDILVSGIAIIIFSPIMILVAAAIKICDGGPVFYKQNRLTKDGIVFSILKFRSMRVDAEKMTGAILSSGENDPRITAIGRIIRAIRFDELPQLFNILSGEMSIVGPRPERPEIASEYEKILPEFRLRLQAKAGLTGYAQVYGKYNTTPYNKLQMDLMYIAHPSIIEDIKICLATIKILFMKDSTEGIKEGSKTAM